MAQLFETKINGDLTLTGGIVMHNDSYASYDKILFSPGCGITYTYSGNEALIFANASTNDSWIIGAPGTNSLNLSSFGNDKPYMHIANGGISIGKYYDNSTYAVDIGGPRKSNVSNDVKIAGDIYVKDVLIPNYTRSSSNDILAHHVNIKYTVSSDTYDFGCILLTKDQEELGGTTFYNYYTFSVLGDFVKLLYYYGYTTTNNALPIYGRYNNNALIGAYATSTSVIKLLYMSDGYIRSTSDTATKSLYTASITYNNSNAQIYDTIVRVG